MEKINEQIRQVVSALNEIWDFEGWTSQRIVDYMEASGEGSVSLSTIKRMRGKDGADKGYNYNNVIKPLKKVFLETPLPAAEELKFDPTVLNGADPKRQVEFLLEQVHIKDSQINALNAQQVKRSYAMHERWMVIEWLAKEVDRLRLSTLLYRILLIIAIVAAAVGFAS